MKDTLSRKNKFCMQYCKPSYLSTSDKNYKRFRSKMNILSIVLNWLYNFSKLYCMCFLFCWVYNHMDRVKRIWYLLPLHTCDIFLDSNREIWVYR